MPDTIKDRDSEIIVEDIYYALAQHIADNDGKDVPLLLKYMLTVDEARIANEMPGSAEEISKRLGLESNQVSKTIKSIVRKGAAHFNRQSEIAYFVGYIVTLTDYGMATPHYDQERGPKYFELVKKIRTSEGYLKEFGEELIREGEAGPLFRVVPRWKSIKNIPGVMPCESIEEIMSMHDGKISTVRCICRTTINDRFCGICEGTLPQEGHCIKFGKMAEHFVEEMGVGEYISAAEAMKLMEETEKAPIYHMIGNSREILGGFCNCCACCCDMRWGLQNIGEIKYGIAPSRFLCVLNSDFCIGCGKCITKCPFDAIVLDSQLSKIKILEHKCMGCGTCVINCKQKALKLELTKGVEHIPTTGNQHIYESLKSL